MNIQTRKRGPFTILKVSGTMFDDSAQLLPTFLPLLEQGDRSFIFDLTAVPNTSTEGISAVVACRNKAVKRNGSVKLVLSQRLRELYTLLMLDTLVDIFDDVEEALASAVEPIST